MASRRSRVHLPAVRTVCGLLIVASAVVIWTGALDGLQTAIPGYTSTLQAKIEGSQSSRLEALEGKGKTKKFGTAPATVGRRPDGLRARARSSRASRRG